MIDIRAIALRDALRNDLPRLVARQEELEKALGELSGDLKDDPIGTGFRLAARFPELRGLPPMLSSINLISVDELYEIAEQHKVPDGTVQTAASIGQRLLRESPLLMTALHRIFPLREDKPTNDEPTQSKANALANLRVILAGSLWSYAGNVSENGSFAEAVKALEQSIQLAHEAGDWLLEAWALWKIALIDPDEGTPRSFAEAQRTPPQYFSRAHDYYARALQILDTTPAAQGSRDADILKVRILLLLCATTLMEKPRETLQYAQEAHAIGAHLQNKSDIFEALIIGGTALVLLKEPTRALTPLLIARSIAVEANDNQMISRVLMQLASAWGLMDNMALASTAMTASILLGPDDFGDNLPDRQSETLARLQEYAHRIKQEGKTEEFLRDLNHGIDYLASQLSAHFSSQQGQVPGEQKETQDSPSLKPDSAEGAEQLDTG